MPIVIMKTASGPIDMGWTMPHAVWNGTLKAAMEWCRQKNDNPYNSTTRYGAVKVKNEGKSHNA
jgi:hypothetical protein